MIRGRVVGSWYGQCRERCVVAKLLHPGRGVIVFHDGYESASLQVDCSILVLGIGRERRELLGHCRSGRQIDAPFAPSIALHGQTEDVVPIALGEVDVCLRGGEGF